MLWKLVPVIFYIIDAKKNSPASFFVTLYLKDVLLFY